MQEVTMLLFLLLAVACGWLLGRWQRSAITKPPSTQPSQAYYRGLNYLLNEQPEQAMDMFLQALNDNSEAIETHLALAKLFRAQGDFSKATQIHQNLLARPNLESAEQLSVQYELASDYMAAGLYDRAERLLKELIESRTAIRQKSLSLLLELYQREMDWPQAIRTAQALLDLNVDGMALVIAQYCCEQAEQAFRSGEENTARLLLKRALSHDSHCIRAYLLLAEIDLDAQQYHEAIKNLKQIKKKDTAYLTESMPVMQNCYQQLRQEKKFYDYLLECLHDGTLISSGFNASQAMRKQAAQPEQLSQHIREGVKKTPSLHGLRCLIDFQMYDASGPSIQYLQTLREFVDQLIAVHPAYRCRQCGYQGKQLAWLCPGCQHWGTIRPTHSTE